MHGQQNIKKCLSYHCENDMAAAGNLYTGKKEKNV